MMASASMGEGWTCGWHGIRDVDEWQAAFGSCGLHRDIHTKPQVGEKMR
jgi:hypothetical protein